MPKIKKIDTADGTLFQVFDEKGNPVGLGKASITDDGSLSVDSLYINPNERGKGHGTSLLNEIKDWGDQNHAKGLTGEFNPLNEDAKSFYENRNIDITSDGKLRGRSRK